MSEIPINEACQFAVRMVSGPTACHLRAGHEPPCKDYLDLRNDRLMETQRELTRLVGELRGLAENWYALAEDPCNGLVPDEWRVYQRCAQELKGVLK